MTKFTIHTMETAPEPSRRPLREIKDTFGSIPNVFGVMAESPALLEGCWALEKIFGEKTSFSRVEQEVVVMSANVENDCRYCVAAHSVAALADKVPGDVIEALREGDPFDDAKLEALRRFASAVVRTRGWPSEEEVKAFLSAGYSKAQLLEVILGVGVKVLTNYTNHIAETPLDAAYEKAKWPGVKAA